MLKYRAADDETEAVLGKRPQGAGEVYNFIDSFTFGQIDTDVLSGVDIPEIHGECAVFLRSHLKDRPIDNRNVCLEKVKLVLIAQLGRGDTRAHGLC